MDYQYYVFYCGEWRQCDGKTYYAWVGKKIHELMLGSRPIK